MYICKCGKTFSKKITLSNHKRACTEYCADLKPIVCDCGIEFNTLSKLQSHIKYCKIYCELNNKEIRKPKNDKNNYKRGWSKERNKEDPVYGDSIRRCGESTSKRLKSMGDNNPLVK